MGDIIKRMNSITEVERVPSAHTGAPVVREATGLPEKPVKPGSNSGENWCLFLYAVHLILSLVIFILSTLRVVDVAFTSKTHSRILTFAFSLLIRLSGFANLPNQLYRKSVKDGFEFSLMVVGESGLGKSTLTNSLFLTDVYSDEYPGPSQRVKKTLEVQKTALSITETASSSI